MMWCSLRPHNSAFLYYYFSFTENMTHQFCSQKLYDAVLSNKMFTFLAVVFIFQYYYNSWHILLYSLDFTKNTMVTFWMTAVKFRSTLACPMTQGHLIPRIKETVQPQESISVGL